MGGRGVIPGAAGLRRRLNAAWWTARTSCAGCWPPSTARPASGCQLVTVVGDPGIGKTRLANELVARLEGRARVLTGRCLPYGEGITFWPVVEVLRDAAGSAARTPRRRPSPRSAPCSPRGTRTT